MAHNKLTLENTYLSLDKRMYSLITPKKENTGDLKILNEELAVQLGIDTLFFTSPEGTQFLLGSTNENGVLYAQAYAGHQFGHFTNLGDGRTLLLGEIRSDLGLYDIQLKGSGTTPYSRSGDGKATLYSMLREYLISETMHTLGIDTTRSLAVLKTNNQVQRETLQQGGILVRVAGSHIRVGTFQYAQSIGGKELVKELADYTINRHYFDLNNKKNIYQLFLREVIRKQAKLIAKWQSIGFVHGVMNTDNMTISGETIDYGPCAFLDTYIPTKSFSSIDKTGRYAFNQQPYIGSWNLARFAETLLELLSDKLEEAVSIANNELEKYKEYFQNEFYKLMGKKIGIIDPIDTERVLIDELLQLMETSNADYTNTFRLLTLDEFDSLEFYNTDEWRKWFQKWTRQLGTRQIDINRRVSLMEQSNPTIIPRNLVVEEALQNATDRNDYTLFNELLSKLKNPYNYRVTHKNKLLNPIKSDKGYVTYCGT